MTGPAASEPDHRVELVLRLPASPAEACAAWTKVALLRRGDAIGADGEQALRAAWREWLGRPAATFDTGDRP